MTQGAQNNGSPLDLDALLATRMLEPKPVKLDGHVYSVRTDLTGAEVTKYFALANDKKDVEGLAILVGARDAKKLNGVLEKLPRAHMVLVVNELMVAAGIVNGVSQADSAGE
jgi:hypothetical protein